jgi:hypothetical protein
MREKWRERSGYAEAVLRFAAGRPHSHGETDSAWVRLGIH